jgi:hypothetical protein
MVILPIFGMKAKNKRVALNLNQYRNWHYLVNSKLKREFKADIKENLNFVIKGAVEIQYKYYAPDNRKRDLMNVVAVVDKYFQDALVETGCIEADDMSIVKKVTARYLGIDRKNPRIEATIKPL